MDDKNLAMVALLPRNPEDYVIYDENLDSDATVDSSELHMTIRFLGNIEDLDPNHVDLAWEEIQALVSDSKMLPLSLNIQDFQISHFGGEEETVAVVARLTYEDPKLHALADAIFMILDAHGLEHVSKHDWVPHVTLAYLPEEEAKRLFPENEPLSQFLPEPGPSEMVFDALWLSFGRSEAVASFASHQPVGEFAPVRAHKTATVDKPWDGPAAIANTKSDEPASYYRQIFAWLDEGDVGSKSNHKFPHHTVSQAGEPGAANVRACVAGIAALNGARNRPNIPRSEFRGVYNHLASHLRDAGLEPPEAKFDSREIDQMTSLRTFSFKRDKNSLIVVANITTDSEIRPLLKTDEPLLVPLARVDYKDDQMLEKFVNLTQEIVSTFDPLQATVSGLGYIKPVKDPSSSKEQEPYYVVTLNSADLIRVHSLLQELYEDQGFIPVSLSDQDLQITMGVGSRVTRHEDDFQDLVLEFDSFSIIRGEEVIPLTNQNSIKDNTMDNSGSTVSVKVFSPMTEAQEYPEDSPTTIEEEFPGFRGVITMEDTPTRDGRIIEAGALYWDLGLNLPLLWQKHTQPGHLGSEVVGRFNRIERVDNAIMGEGPFNIMSQGAFESAMALDGEFQTGISVDLANVEAEESGMELRVLKGEIVGATLVAIPAFAEAQVEYVVFSESERHNLVASAGYPVVPTMRVTFPVQI